MIMSEKRTKYLACPEDPPDLGTFIKFPCFNNFRPGAMILGNPPQRLFCMSIIFMPFSCSRSCSLICQATFSICSRASLRLVLSGWVSGVFLITSSNSSLYLKVENYLLGSSPAVQDLCTYLGILWMGVINKALSLCLTSGLDSWLLINVRKTLFFSVQYSTSLTAL